MKLQILLGFGALALFVSIGLSQASKRDTAAPAQPASISDLVLQGKINDAVKLAVKAPATLDAAWSSLMTSIDTMIIMRNLDKAQTGLDATKGFADACEKSKRIKIIPREAIQGRQLRLTGIRLSDQKEYAKSAEALQQALDLSKKTKDRALESGVHNNLGYALQYQGKAKEAATEYDSARLIAEELKDNLRASSSNYNLGNVLLGQEKYAEAQAAFRRAAVQANASAQYPLEALSVFMQGVASSQSDPRNIEAIEIFRDASAKFEKIGDYTRAGGCYEAMAKHSGMSGDFKKVIEHGEKAIPLYEKAGNKEALVRLYDFLAMIHVTQSETAKAEAYTKKSQELSKELAVQKEAAEKKGDAVKKDGAVKK